MDSQKLKLGFIGCGNMAKAIINGVVAKGLIKPEEIGFYDPKGYNVPQGIVAYKNNSELVKSCEYIILAVKPKIAETVLKEIAPVIEKKPVGSIMAGISTDFISGILKEAHILRIMPNTCATICKSYTCLSSDNTLTDVELKMFHDIFSAVGKVEMVSETYFNVCAAVCSCGVAFGHMLVEAMADGGVVCGMSKDKSIEMAAYAVEGACGMIMETGKSPTALKDEICSPGGMTAKAMQALEDGGFRASVINAIEAAYNKGKNIQ